MSKSVIFKKTIDLEPQFTVHGIGKKQVFLSREKCESNVHQVAFGTLISGEKVEEHVHDTMEEFYYFLSGKSTFHIGNDIYNCENGVFLMIPSKTKHYLFANSDSSFIYWGVGINNI